MFKEDAAGGEVLAFATVDSEGTPQIRNISAIHYEPDALYFFTARGKNFCKKLTEDGRVQVLAYTKYKEMIRLSGKAYAVAENEQKKWMDIIFEEQPYLANVYPGYTREIGIIFCIDKAEVGYIFKPWSESDFPGAYSWKCKCKRKGILHNRILYRLRDMYETLSTEMY